MVLGLLNPRDMLPEGAGLLGASCSSRWLSVMVFVPGAARDKRASAGVGHIPDSHRMSHLHLGHQDLDLPPRPPHQLVLSAPGSTDWAPQQARPKWWHPKKHGRGGGTPA